MNKKKQNMQNGGLGIIVWRLEKSKQKINETCYKPYNTMCNII